MNKKVLMMLNNKKKNNYSDIEHEDYPIENKFRDRRGREHYDNGRYAPMSYGGETRIDNRSRRDSRGRYTSTRSDYGPPYVEPIYHGEYANEREEYKPMNKIGFAIDGEMEKLPDEIHNNYKSEAGYQSMDEMRHRSGSGEYMNGYGRTGEYMPMTKELAKEWTEHMKNEDGTVGPHWSLEQAKQVMAQRGIEGSPIDFWVALNATYSDLCKMFKKHGINTIDAYVDYAKAFWLDDKDSVPNKLSAYYDYVVKH